MSLNTVIAFALLLKKITRKGSMGKKHFRNKMKRNKPATNLHNTSCSSSGSDDDEEEEEDFDIIQYNNDYNLMNTSNKKSNSSIITPSIKSLQLSQKHNSLKQPLDELITIVSPPTERKSLIVLSSSCEDINIVKHHSMIITSSKEDEAIITTITTTTTEEEAIDSDEITITTADCKGDHDDEITPVVMIRDFAYSIESPLHYGKSLKPQYSSVSLSSPDFNGREARALFDFIPETEYELPLKTGQTIWVQYRQCPGWLIADVQDETGLIPETYVEFI